MRDFHFYAGVAIRDSFLHHRLSEEIEMITTGNWQDALEPIARKELRPGFKEKPAERDMFFDVKKSSKLTETYLELGDIGSMEKFNGDLAYDDVSAGLQDDDRLRRTTRRA
jgi:hypothetical protein